MLVDWLKRLLFVYAGSTNFVLSARNCKYKTVNSVNTQTLFSDVKNIHVTYTTLNMLLLLRMIMIITMFLIRLIDLPQSDHWLACSARTRVKLHSFSASLAHLTSSAYYLSRMLAIPWRRLFLAAYILWAKPDCCCFPAWQSVSCHCCPAWQTVVCLCVRLSGLS